MQIAVQIDCSKISKRSSKRFRLRTVLFNRGTVHAVADDDRRPLLHNNNVADGHFLVRKTCETLTYFYEACSPTDKRNSCPHDVLINNRSNRVGLSLGGWQGVCSRMACEEVLRDQGNRLTIRITGRHRWSFCTVR